MFLAWAAAMNRSKIGVQRGDSRYSYSEAVKIPHARYTCLCLERLRLHCDVFSDFSKPKISFVTK